MGWSDLAGTLVRSAIAAAAMSVVVVGLQYAVPLDAAGGRTRLAVQVALSIGGGAITYLAAAWLLGMRELRLLLTRPKPSADTVGD